MSLSHITLLALCCGFAIVCASFVEKPDTLTEKSLLPSPIVKQVKNGKAVESERSYGGGPLRYIISTVNSNSQQPSQYGGSPPSAYGQPSTSTPAPYQTTRASSAAPYYNSPSSTPAAPAAPLLLGSRCSASSDCAGIPNSRCFNGVCDCSGLSTPLGNLACLPLANAFGDKCVITAQCRGLDPLASCYLDRCMCESIYYVAGTSCSAQGSGDYYLPGTSVGGGRIQCLKKQTLGGACCDDRQCSYEVWNSKCVNNQCQCNSGFVNIGTHACAPKATMLGSNCSVNAQCMSLPGSSCSINGTCTCDAQSQFVTGMILPTVGGATDRRKRQAMAMLMANSMGLMSVMCMPTVRLGDMCMSNEQCSARTPNAICAMGVCTCSNGFASDTSNSTCQKKAVVFQKSRYQFRVSCCGNTTATQSRFIGQVCPDAVLTNLPPPYTFALSDPRFTIDSNGAISTNTVITAPVTITATISSGTRSDTADIVLVPDPCCLQSPVFSTSMVSVTLLRAFGGTGAARNCRIPGPNAAVPAAGAGPNTLPFLLNILDFLNMPCGELLATSVTPGTITTTPQTPALSGAACTLRPGGDLEFFSTAAAAPFPEIAAGMSATCAVPVTVTGCNGIVAMSTLNVILMCPT